MKKICDQCKAELNEDEIYCPVCGKSVTSEEAAPDAEPVTSYAQEETAEEPMPVAQASQPLTKEDVKGTKFQPVSTLGFVGIFLLSGIPVIGWIFILVWACGGCRKLVKRTYARACLIMAAISLAITVAIGFVVKNVIETAIKDMGANGMLGEFGQLLGDDFSLDDLGIIVDAVATITESGLTTEDFDELQNIVSNYTESGELTEAEMDKLQDMLTAVVGEDFEFTQEKVDSLTALAEEKLSDGEITLTDIADLLKALKA